MPTIHKRQEFYRAVIVLSSACATLWVTGCAERKVHAFPWATAVMVRPNAPTARTAGNSDGADIAPDLRLEAPANPPRIFSTRPVPPRPHVNTPPTAETLAPTKSPGLVPELSPQETAAAKEQVSESITVAERNAAIARGKNLTPTQADVLSKIAGFLAEAREASNEGDWGRARNLAKKAQILSEDLVGSP